MDSPPAAKSPSRSGGSGRVTKLLAMLGMVMAGVIAVVFTADLAAAVPFGRASVVADAGFIVSSLLVGYASWLLMDRGRA